MKRSKSIDYGRVSFVLVVIIILIFGIDALVRFFKNRNFEYNYDSYSSYASDANESGNTTAQENSDLNINSNIDSSSALESNIDINNYSVVTKNEADLAVGSLILVNEKYNYIKKEELSSFKDKKNEFYRLLNYNLLINNTVIEPANKMFEAFYNTSSIKNIMLYSTNEDHDMSNSLYSQRLPERAAGFSMDMTVLNDDSSVKLVTDTAPYNWFSENANKYGFVIRYTKDKKDITGQSEQPWHLRYVGLPHAAIMKEKNLCLEEYIDILKNYTFESEHLTYTFEDDLYEIYFVPSLGKSTDIYIAKNKEFTISGNNIDGYIVTVKL